MNLSQYMKIANFGEEWQISSYTIHLKQKLKLNKSWTKEVKLIKKVNFKVYFYIKGVGLQHFYPFLSNLEDTINTRDGSAYTIKKSSGRS